VRAGGPSATDRLGELSDEAYLHLQVETKSIFNCLLSDRDQFANILCCGLTQIDHDVGVDVRYLSITVPESFQAALIYEPPRPNALDLLENRTGARMELEPGMSASAPAQILLHDAMHHRGITG